jgi:Phytanoyl-CoA dioxygenase (PhyH)
VPEAVLDEVQLAFYRAFGYVVLPGFFAPDEIRRLRAEVESGVRAVAGDTFGDPERAGLNGHYLPLTDAGSPFSASLPTSPRLLAAARQLLGQDVVPDYGMGILYFGETGWHTDHRWPLASVKFAAYFEELDESSGALTFLPAATSRRARALVTEYRRAVHRDHPGRANDPYLVRLPGAAAPTRPGDVVLISGHVWHASFGGRNRWSWTLSFTRAPETARQAVAFSRMLRDLTFWPRLEFSAAGYPFYTDYWHDLARHTRPELVRRMETLGMFEAAARVTSVRTTQGISGG